MDVVLVVAPDGPSTVLDADEAVDGVKNSMDSFAVSLDTGGRFADANKSAHYHHCINGYSCHSSVEQVTLKEKCPEWVVLKLVQTVFARFQIWS